MPPPLRPFARRLASELPIRLRDALPDLKDKYVSLEPLPPPWLRSRVGWSSSRREFSSVGGAAWRDIAGAIIEANGSIANLRDWLDFGCGPGRVARHVLDSDLFGVRIVGLDVDREAIDWCRQHLLGRYEVVGANPPTNLPDATFDIAYSVSVFTHLSESRQSSWLDELRRILRPGGILVVSTHSPDLAWTRPDLSAEQQRDLADTGHLFAPSGREFNDDSAFHSEEYLRRTWGERFRPLWFRSHGLSGYQDLSVWRKT